mgnify:CR=1 FL=1
MMNCIVCRSENVKLFCKIKKLIYWKCCFCKAKFLDKKNYISYNEEKKHYLKHNNSLNDQGYRNFLLSLVKPLKEKIEADARELNFLPRVATLPV